MTKIKLYKKQLKQPTPANITKYKDYKKLYNRLLKAAETAYLASLFSELKTDIRRTWNTINDTIGRTKGKGLDIPNSFRDTNRTYNTPSDIVMGFNDYFADIGQSLQNTIGHTDKTIHDYLGPGKNCKFTLRELNADEIL